MSVCVLQNLEKYRVLWTDFLACCREINRSSVSKIGPEPAKPTISLALIRSTKTIIAFQKTIPSKTSFREMDLNATVIATDGWMDGWME